MERLQKLIARSGLYSRRQAEELISQGKVTVDGKKVTVLGTKVALDAKVVVKGKRIHLPTQHHYLIFHKPRGCVVTRDDPENRKTIYDYLPPKFANLKPVGRLDYDSQGLLVLTNDGSYAQKATHPRFRSEKTYEVKVSGKVGRRQLARLQKGILLDGRPTLPMEAKVLRENQKSTWLQMVLTEGRNRQIRRMCEKVNLVVKTLVRTQFGGFKLKGVAYGQWRLEVSIK